MTYEPGEYIDIHITGPVRSDTGGMIYVGAGTPDKYHVIQRVENSGHLVIKTVHPDPQAGQVWEQSSTGLRWFVVSEDDELFFVGQAGSQLPMDKFFDDYPSAEVLLVEK